MLRGGEAFSQCFPSAVVVVTMQHMKLAITQKQTILIMNTSAYFLMQALQLKEMSDKAIRSRSKLCFLFPGMF